MVAELVFSSKPSPAVRGEGTGVLAVGLLTFTHLSLSKHN